jgi:exopolyphosphatase/guanosine-5'-triphosphate,3'-diphosphate pyrophosphatase
MRLGVIDIGSNTVHLLVVDAHPGAQPLPAFSHKTELRLSESLDPDGRVSDETADHLVGFIRECLGVAEDQGVSDLFAFATSALRESPNGEAVIERVRAETGVDLETLSGTDEARMTFLAVRRWFGWSAGRLAVFDIGGGSLEIAGGSDEEPDVAWSIPLGAARLAREHFDEGMPGEKEIRALRKRIRADIAEDAGHLLRGGPPDVAAATSKTFRSLARICGAAPSEDGPLVDRRLTLADLREWIPRLIETDTEDLAELPGVSPSRTHQIVPGALVAEAVMDIFGLPELQICPWALREGVILERLDQLSDPR